MLLFAGVKASCDDGYYVQNLNMGEETASDKDNNNSSQTFTKSELPSLNPPVSGSVDTSYTPSINNYYYNYYPYPQNTIVYRNMVPYYRYGMPGYTYTQPAYVMGYGMGGGMSVNYHNNGFNFGASTGSGYKPLPSAPITSRTTTYLAPTQPFVPPPPPPPMNRDGRNYAPPPPPPPPVHNLPSNVVYKR